MSLDRGRPLAGWFCVAFSMLSALPSVHAAQRIQQLAEDGVVTRRLSPPTSPLSVPETQICEPGAKWLRLSFSALTLAPYDSLSLVSSLGERYTFEGDAFNGRHFSARALQGDCVSVQTSFGSTDSHYQIEGYQFGSSALSATPVVVAGAGDICDTTSSTCQGTSDLIVNINPTAVFTAGDNAYTNGTLSEFNNRYAPTWGRFKVLTNPTPGNHEYNTSGASGYFDYFNGVGQQTGPAGDRSKGYYSWDVGDWHFIALNSMSGGTVAQAQLTWLQADLDANTKPCTAAYWHHPLVSVGNYSGYSQVKPFWDKLYAAHADLVLVGHDHNYQRYAPMKPDKSADSVAGIRQVLVGTGGRVFYSITGSHPLLEKSNASSYGVLKLTLTASGYNGEFVRSSGSFSDTFSGTCHNATTTPNVPPVANFSFVTNGLVANFIDGSSDSDGSVVSRAWNFGDGATSTAASPSHTYATAGSRAVSLTATDDKGASHTVTKTVSVSAPTNTPPVANFTFTISGLNVAFNDGSSDSDGSIVSRSWNFADGSSATTTNPTHTYAAPGNYNVVLTVTDNAGASASKTTIVPIPTQPQNILQNGVTVNNLSAATGGEINYVMSVPAGASSLKFAIAGGSGDADLYVKFGAAPTDSSYECRPYLNGNAETCSIASAQAGIYYVRVKAYAAYAGVGLTGSYTAPGSNQAPSASFNAATSALTAAFTDTSSDSDGSIVSRQWNFGDASTSTATNPVHTYAAAGSYTVSLTVTDNGGASNTVSQAVTVTLISPPDGLQNGVTVTNQSASKNAMLNYTMNVPAGASNLKFVISGGSGDADLYVRYGSAPTTSSYDCRPYSSGNNETCTITPTQAGTYYVMLRGYAAFSGVSLTGSYTP